MPEQTIICPNCRTAIKLTEAIAAPMIERLRAQFEADARQRADALARREQALEARSREVEKSRAAIQARVEERVAAERARIAREESTKAARTLAAEMADLRAQLQDQGSKLDEARKNELELRKQRRDLEDQHRRLRLENARTLDEERKAIRDAAQKELAQEHRLKDAEKEQRLTAMRRQIDDLKRKAEQGSQQVQGEVLELELEALLASRFPMDVIEPVGKGVRGADVLQRVRDARGGACGTIIWESKRTRTWSDGWLPKLRDDQRGAKAEIAAIVSIALPKDIATFAQVDGVWVTSRPCVVALATALRATLLEVHAIKQAHQGRQGKMDVLYAYLAGPQFRQRVEAVFESYVEMCKELDREKAALQRHWAKREKQLERLLTNTVGLHGDVAGIIGGTLQEIEALDLKALAADDGEDVDG